MVTHQLVNHQHDCAVPGCGTLIPASLLLCSRHWGMLGDTLRQEIHHNWASYQAALRSVARARTGLAHPQARAQALAQVEAASGAYRQIRARAVAALTGGT